MQRVFYFAQLLRSSFTLARSGPYKNVVLLVANALERSSSATYLIFNAQNYLFCHAKRVCVSQLAHRVFLLYRIVEMITFQALARSAKK